MADDEIYSPEDEIEEKSDDAKLIADFESFIRKVYHKKLLEADEAGSALAINFKDLDEFSPELGELLQDKPNKFFEITGKVMDQLQLHNKVPLRILGLLQTVSVRDLRSKHIGKFVSVEGVVKRASEIRPELIECIWDCPECGLEIKQERKGNFIGYPSFCPCGNKKGFKQKDKKMMDTRWMTIEEPFELTEGERPSQVTILLRDDLVSPDGRRISEPGNRLKITGILVDMPRGKGPAVKLDFYLDANHVEPTEIGWSKLQITKEDQEKIKEMASDPKIYKTFVDSIAPSIYGMDEVKESIVLQIFGGVPRVLKDGTKLRGDIHLLLIGDPSSGKCVSGDTKVVLKSGEIKKIRDIVEKKLATNTQKISDGVYAHGNDDILSMGLDGAVVPTKANIFWKREKPDSMYKVKTSTGKEICVTPTHPFFVCKNGFITSKKAEDVVIGDRIAAPSRLAVDGKQQKIDIKINRSPARNGNHIIIPEITSKEFCSFIAYILAEGYVQKTKTTCLIWFTNNDGKLLEDFERCAGIFGITVHKRQPHKGKNAFDFYLSSIELGQFLEKLEPKILEKSRGKKIPDIIMRCSDDEVKAFLRAYFDCEANVTKNEIQLTSASREMLEQIQAILLRFGIVVSMHSTYKRATNSPNPVYREYYRIYISGDNVEKFKKHIGFSVLKKKEKLDNLEAKVSISDSIPNLSGFFRELRNSLGLFQRELGIPRSTYEHFEREDRQPTKQSLSKIIERLKTISKEKGIPVEISEKINILEKLCQSDIFWDSVKSIEKVVPEEEWVYDLQVPEVHNFIANGIFVHNSQLLKLVPQIVPRGKYVSGKGATSAGLTATVSKDEQFMGGWVLEAGAMVLAHKGLLAVDEFEKMAHEDQVAMHEALEQGCYDGGTEIILEDGSKTVIGDFVEQFVKDENGEKVVKDIRDKNIYLLSSDFKQIRPSKAVAVGKHIEDRLYKIELGAGHKIKITPDHPVFAIRSGSIFPIKAKELRVGDYIPVPKRLSIHGSPQPLQIQEIIKDRKHKKITFPKTSNKELCEWIGLVVAEGNAEVNRKIKNGVCFSNTDKDILQRYIQISRKLFSVDPYIQNREKDTLSMVRIISRPLYGFVNSLGSGILAKPWEKSLPKWIDRVSNEEVSYLLRGLFDGEGSVNYKYGTITFSTTSRLLAEQIQGLLLRFGIFSAVYEDRSMKGLRKHKAYKLQISSKENIENFAEYIGFVGRRRYKLEKLLKKPTKSSIWNHVPNVMPSIDGIKKALKLSYDEIAGHELTLARSRNNITKDMLKRIVGRFDSKIKLVEAALKKLDKEISYPEFKKLRESCNISRTEIAKKLGMSEQNLWYHKIVKNDKRLLKKSVGVVKKILMGMLEQKKAVENIKFILEAPVEWIRIKSINLQKGRQWVYDVAMNPTGIFIGNNIICHNSVSIAKASIVATLPAQTSVLAGGNPKFSRFDPMMSIAKQITIPDTLLSIAPDEPSLLKENGVVKVCRVADIVDRIAGEKESIPIEVTGLEAPAMNKDYKIEWWPVRYLFRHKSRLPLYKIWLASGRKITVTKGHSVFVLEDGELKSKPSDSVGVGSWISIPKRLPSPEKHQEKFNIAEELLQLPPEVVGQAFLHNIPQEAISRLGIENKNWRHGKKLPLKYAKLLTADELKVCTLKYKGGSKNGVPVETCVNGDLARLLGYYIAEGSMFVTDSKEHLVSFAFGNKDKRLIEDAANAAKNLFNQDVKYIKSANGTKVNIANKIVWLFFEHILKLPKGAKNKCVPELVWNIPANLQIEFLRAYHAGDYCVTVSERLMSDLLYLFLMNGVLVSSHENISKGATLKDGRKIKGGRFFSLVDAAEKISSLKSTKTHSYIPLEPFKPVLSLLSHGKFKGNYYGKKKATYLTPGLWNKIINKQEIRERIRRLELLKTPITAEGFAKEIYKTNRPKRAQTEFARNYLNGLIKRGLVAKQKKKACSYSISELGFSALEKLGRIELLLLGDVGFVKVKKIEEMPPTETYVYDLSTPGHENFIAGFGGIICHNSRFDLKFILKDIPNEDTDKKITEHVLKSREDDYEASRPKLDADTIRKYVAYAKENCKPRVTKEVGKMLRGFYVEQRKRAEGGSAPIPLTLRQFEALIRLSEASAKIQLSDAVRKEDAERAIKLMKYSLKQLGTDPDTGLIDIDRAEGSTPASERSHIRIVLDIINELSEKKKEVLVFEILDRAKKDGVGNAEEIVDKLKREGMLFEPNPGYVQKV